MRQPIRDFHPEEMLSYSQIARVMNVSHKTVTDLIAKGFLRVVKFPGAVPKVIWREFLEDRERFRADVNMDGLKNSLSWRLR